MNEFDIVCDCVSSMIHIRFQKYEYICLFTGSKESFTTKKNILEHVFQKIWMFKDRRLIFSRFLNFLKIPEISQEFIIFIEIYVIKRSML